MQAAVLRRRGAPDGIDLEELERPVPAPDELLLRVEAVCANRTDLHVIEGTKIGRAATLPHVGGVDPAGIVVEAARDGSGPVAGTRVVARPLIPCLACRFCAADRERLCERPAYVGVHRPGGFAEYVGLPSRAVFALPDGLDAVTASASAHSIPLAIELLEEVGRVGPADVVVVVGAGGGLGLAVVGFARHLGATVVAVAGDERRLAAARAAGAAAAVSSASPSGLADRIRAAAGGRGATVAVDNVGDAALWPEVVAALDKGGRILSCGAHAGGRLELDLALFYRMQLSLLASSGTTAAGFRRALELAASGAVRPGIDSVRPLSGIRGAFEDLLARRTVGRIVLRPGT